MKKLALLFVFVQSLVFANDPVITLIGDSVIEICMGCTFVDPGATAVDVEDGDITNSIQVSGSVNTNTLGTYVLAYNVTDSDGNSAAVVVRTINVVDNFNPSLALTISASFSGNDDVLDIGDTITYDIILSNTGNTDLWEFFIYVIALTDFNGNGVTLTTPPTFFSSSYSDYGYSIPGEQHIYRATYLVGQDVYESGGLTLQLRGHGHWQETIVIDELLELSFGTSSDEIILDGQISANNNQIKKVADPTDNLDAVNKRYVDQRTLEQTIPGQNIGDLLYWNGQSWQKLSAPQEQSTLRFCEGQLTWGPCKVKLFLKEQETALDYIDVEVLVVSNGSFISEIGVYVSTTNQMPNENDITYYENQSLDFDKSFDFSASPNTTYFVRAYAINNESLEKSYSEVITITTPSGDQNGNAIYSKIYGNQEWATQNAKVTTYRDGTPIPQVTDGTEWGNLTTGAWCYIDNNAAKGKLYNWYAVAGIHDNDPDTPNKEFAPEGWHVPTYADWTTFEEHLIASGYNYDETTTGNKIAKSVASKYGWNSSTNTGVPGNNQGLNNRSGFNAFPWGDRGAGDGLFYSEGVFALFWSSDQHPDFPLSHSWAFSLGYSQSHTRTEPGPKINGLSVRFIKD